MEGVRTPPGTEFVALHRSKADGDGHGEGQRGVLKAPAHSRQEPVGWFPQGKVGLQGEGQPCGGDRQRSGCLRGQSGAGGGGAGGGVAQEMRSEGQVREEKGWGRVGSRPESQVKPVLIWPRRHPWPPSTASRVGSEIQF